MKHPHRGFTLIEVAISMVILGLLYQRQNPPPRLDMVDLGTPPPAMMVRTAALGESAFAGYLVMMFLQNVDVPVGRATPLADLERNTASTPRRCTATRTASERYPATMPMPPRAAS
jgi:prepilin-type N-terminal cleavage/methylation domain-containing protein